MNPVNLLNFDAIREQRGDLVMVLEQAGAQFKGDTCKCPFHDDRTASAGIYQGADGGWRFKCQSMSCGESGDVLDIRAKLNGRSRSEEIKSMRQDSPKAKSVKVYPTLDDLKRAAVNSDREGGTCTSQYKYIHPATKAVEMIVFRIQRQDGSKTFRQGSPRGEGWALKAPEGLWPIYNRSNVAVADLVIVVEGEKAVHALHGIKITSTTSPGGAGKAHLADWTPLSGKTVYLWPDCDPEDQKTHKRTGLEHMRQVAAELGRLENPPQLFWIDCDRLALPDKGDAFDFVAMHGADARSWVDEVIQQAEPMGALADLDKDLNDAMEGKRYAVPMVWGLLSKVSRALVPATVTILCGSPGSTKSLAMLQNMCHWKANGVECAVLEMEDTRAYHLRRMLAQMDGNGNLTVDEWAKENQEAVKEARAKYKAFLSKMAPCVDMLPHKVKPTPDAIAEWIERKAVAGCRVIVVDPITMMIKQRHAGQDDHDFMYAVKQIIERHGCSLFLVTHPRKLAAGQKLAQMTMDDLAGGVSYSRFAQTIFCLLAHEWRKSEVETMMGRKEEDFNRTMVVFKARNGSGIEGFKYAFKFDARSLTMHEAGLIRD